MGVSILWVRILRLRTLVIAALACILIIVSLPWVFRKVFSVSEIRPPSAPEPAEARPLAFERDDWPFWRGPSGDNSSADPPPAPSDIAPHKATWKTRIAGRGLASPIVHQGRAYILTADEESSTQSLLAVSLTTGEVLWTCETHRGRFPLKHEKNSFASATPACDGERIFVCCLVNDAVSVAAVDLSGKLLWRTDAGPFISLWGYGSSPTVHGRLVFVSGENQDPTRLGRFRDTSFFAALDRKSGAIVWRVARPAAHSFCSPVVATVAGREQLMMAGHAAIVSYDPETGRELWRCRWPAARMAGTMAFSDSCVIATSTQPSKLTMCIRADGTGDVTDTHVVWSKTNVGSDVPSPLVSAGRLFLVDDGGVASWLDMATGELLGKGRLKGSVCGSPVRLGETFAVLSEEGLLQFARTSGGKLEIDSAESLGEATLTTPVFCGGRVLIRSEHHLWCFANSSRK